MACLLLLSGNKPLHYSDVIMSAMASLITTITIVYSAGYSDADQRKHQSSAPLAFVRGIHRLPVNSHHIWSVTQKMLTLDDIIMTWANVDPDLCPHIGYNELITHALLEWGCLSQFPSFGYYRSFFFRNYLNISYLLHTTFIFDQYRHSFAETTPVNMNVIQKT